MAPTPLRSQGEFYMTSITPVDTSTTTDPAATAECTICLEPLETNVVKLPCDHMFHCVCVLGWFDKDAPREGTKKGSCPNCRMEMYEPDRPRPAPAPAAADLAAWGDSGQGVGSFATGPGWPESLRGSVGASGLAAIGRQVGMTGRRWDVDIDLLAAHQAERDAARIERRAARVSRHAEQERHADLLERNAEHRERDAERHAARLEREATRVTWSTPPPRTVAISLGLQAGTGEEEARFAPRARLQGSRLASQPATTRVQLPPLNTSGAARPDEQIVQGAETTSMARLAAVEAVSALPWQNPLFLSPAPPPPPRGFPVLGDGPLATWQREQLDEIRRRQSPSLLEAEVVDQSEPQGPPRPPSSRGTLSSRRSSSRRTTPRRPHPPRSFAPDGSLPCN